MRRSCLATSTRKALSCLLDFSSRARHLCRCPYLEPQRATTGQRPFPIKAKGTCPLRFRVFVGTNVVLNGEAFGSLFTVSHLGSVKVGTGISVMHFCN